MASNGTGYGVAWEQDDGFTDRIMANVSTGAWTTGATVTLDFADGVTQSPRIASDGMGYVVVWHQTDTAGEESIRSSSYTGTWSIPHWLDSRPIRLFEPRIASDGAGYRAVWFHFDGEALSVHFSTETGGVWSEAARLNEGSGSALGAAIDDMPDGGYVAAWIQEDPGAPAVCDVYSAVGF